MKYSARGRSARQNLANILEPGDHLFTPGRPPARPPYSAAGWVFMRAGGVGGEWAGGVDQAGLWAGGASWGGGEGEQE